MSLSKYIVRKYIAFSASELCLDIQFIVYNYLRTSQKGDRNSWMKNQANVKPEVDSSG